MFFAPANRRCSTAFDWPAGIVTEIVRRFPDAGVQTVRFVGPDVPSWKWGPRAVPGRGPRDTYG